VLFVQCVLDVLRVPYCLGTGYFVRFVVYVKCVGCTSEAVSIIETSMSGIRSGVDV
jgi:hypothetical protein